jgi:hypothetical protein
MTIRRRRMLAAAASAILAVAGFMTTAGPALAAAAAHRATGRDRPGYLTEPGRLYHVAGTSAKNLWAVGLSSNGSLIEHYNGKRWSLAEANSLGWFYNGVAVTSASNAWAVGGTNWFAPCQTVIEHWNGHAWSRVPTPTPDGSAVLTAVTATSATNAWASGYIGGGPGDAGVTIPLILHWNGHHWRQQAVHEPPNGGQFADVSAISASNAWAVGYWSNSSPNGALIEHWNGKKWTSLVTHAPTDGVLLQGVDAIAPNDVWAAGISDGVGVVQSLTEHWNGHSWHVVASPNPTGNTNLIGISGTSDSNVWAVGYTNSNGCDPDCGTAAFHFNGHKWTAVPSPTPSAGNLDAFLGVIALSGRDAWAVGSNNWASTIISHWNGKAWN